MSDKTLQDLKVDAHIAVLHTKVDALIEKQKELTQRVRANEKVVAAIGLLGSIALAFIGAGYFAPKADAAPTAGEWIHQMREWESKKNRAPVEDSINNALADMEYDYGGTDTTEQEELLQLPSSVDRQGAGRRHDRCHHRSWFRPIQKGESESSGSGHAGEEN